jgi:hypothetical protein
MTRFWQLVSATEKCCQNRVLRKPDSGRTKKLILLIN